MKFTHVNPIGRLLLAGAVGVIVATLIATAAIAGNLKREIIAIDRTGSTTQVASWASEVAGSVTSEAEKAIADDVDDLTLISIGATTADTATVAKVNLDIDCPNSKVCADDKRTLAKRIGAIAGELASAPVENPGSDLVAAVQTAKAICGKARCKIVLVSDGIDTRLFSSTASGDALAQQVAPLLPNLKRTTVHLIGLGADGSPAEAVERTRTFWLDLLSSKSARDIQIARSL